MDLGKRRVHHQDQPQSDGDIRRAALELIDKRFDTREEIADQNPDSHGQKDPQREKSIEKRELLHVECLSSGMQDADHWG
jgi:hypothetical protein